jgi:hypothetical protein
MLLPYPTFTGYRSALSPSRPRPFTALRTRSSRAACRDSTCHCFRRALSSRRSAPGFTLPSAPLPLADSQTEASSNGKNPWCPTVTVHQEKVGDSQAACFQPHVFHSKVGCIRHSRNRRCSDNWEKWLKHHHSSHPR